MRWKTNISLEALIGNHSVLGLEDMAWLLDIKKDIRHDIGKDIRHNIISGIRYDVSVAINKSRYFYGQLEILMLMFPVEYNS